MTKFEGRGTEYELATQHVMVKNPARYAVSNELVDKHEPETIRKVGVWRWPAIQKHGDLILSRVKDSRTLDFGGAAGGLGYGAEVVDYGVANKALYDVSGWFNTVFTSHTLEHIVDLPLCLQCLNCKLENGGTIIAHVPSWHSERWRAENFDLHEHTFCLNGDEDVDPTYLPLDSMIRYYLEVEIEIAEHVGESLIVIGKRRKPKEG